MPSPLTTNNTTSKDATADSSRNSEWHKEGSSGSRTESFSHFQPSEKTYEEVSVIGTGAYGTVYKAKDLANNGQYVALKKVRIPLAEDGVPINTLREIALLKQLDTYDHPNVVRLLDICHGRRMEQEQQMVLYLVFEHVDQDLATYLEKCPSPGLGPDRIKDIMYQLLNGIDFLHSNRIVHRDLKPQNILISNHGVLKLADFGLARIFDSKMILTSVVVTLWYRPPEVLLQRTYATPVDVWSSGCIFAELFRRKPLFTGVNEADQLIKIFEVIGSPLESEWPTDVSLPWTSFRFYRGVPFTAVIPEICTEGADLIQSMLIFGPSQRITCSEALHHPYFSEYELNPPSSSRYNSRSVSFGYQSRSNGVRRIS